MEKYRLEAIQSLAAQLARGPRRLRLRQLLSIEFLLSVIESNRHYPYDFVCHALTGFRAPVRPGNGETLLLEPGLLVADLVGLADQLSDDADIPLKDWRERPFTAPELAERFDVSTKTIFRWRRRGLAGWKFRFPDQRKRLLFPERCVRRFVAQNAALVARGSSFSQLTKEERQRIVEQAKELVRKGCRTVNSVARVVSEGSGRAVETIRLILKHYDEAHPQAGLFNRTTLDVDLDERRLALWEAYVDGATVEALAERFGRSIRWVYRTITHLRARELRGRKMEFVPSDEFEQPQADRKILRTPTDGPLRQELSAAKRRVPADLPPYLAQLFWIPLLTPVGEVTLFRKMNYLKFKAVRLRDRMDPETARATELDRIEALLEQAARVKNEIVQANLRLVVSIAKRHVRPDQDLFELISDGNVSLMRAVEKFDYMRGFKFSTYASWAVIRNFARSIPEQHRHHERYQSGWEELLDGIAAVNPDETESDYLSAVRVTLDRMLATLDEREGCILRQRYGLDQRGQTQTLEQIGKRLGVSKERIRQLEARAISRLRCDFADDMERLLGT